MNPTATPAAAAAEPPPPAPPPAVRGERWLAAADHALAVVDGWITRTLPGSTNPLAHAGQSANFALLVAVVSGIALLLWYSPSLHQAYPSLAALEGRTLGGWVRALHRYSSDLVMLLLLVHAGRTFVARKFVAARWIAWVSGIGLVALIWFIGWTGYWLVWDEPAQIVAVSSMRLLDALPVFGEPLGRLYVLDETVPSLLFFVVFFLHMLLPLGIAIGLVVHLLRLSQTRLLPDRRLSAALLVGLAFASWLVPAPLDGPAAMTRKAPAFTVDAWYLSPLALDLRLQHGGLWLALGGAVAAGAAVPWVLRRRRQPVQFQAKVNVTRCHACTQCVQDCPFDAIAMVARTDGKGFASQAEVDPARCVGCGVCGGSCDSDAIGLEWFDTLREEARIERAVRSGMDAGGPHWVALVAADAEGATLDIAGERWRPRLPGYHVQAVPTASWVRSSLVERLLRIGAEGVLVVRDARGEAAARHGNRWVAERLERERKPFFRPERGRAGGVWRVLDSDPSDLAGLRREAERFRNGQEPSPPSSPWPRRIATIALLSLAGMAGTVGPSHLRVANPASPEPEFVFSFRALGEFKASAASVSDQADRPVHMRGVSTAKPHRSEILVRLEINGRTEERRFRPKGISRDGPAIDVWSVPLVRGDNLVAIELLLGPGSPARRWEGTISAEERRRHVVTFDPVEGFRSQ